MRFPQLLKGFNDEQLARLARELQRRSHEEAEALRLVSVHEVAGWVGSSRAAATAVLRALELAHEARLFLGVYHGCVQDLPVAIRPVEQGFVEAPWRCPECGDELHSDDVKLLRYETMAKVYRRESAPPPDDRWWP